jgi:hypothetical protein
MTTQSQLLRRADLNFSHPIAVGAGEPDLFVPHLTSEYNTVVGLTRRGPLPGVAAPCEYADCFYGARNGLLSIGFLCRPNFVPRIPPVAS